MTYLNPPLEELGVGEKSSACADITYGHLGVINTSAMHGDADKLMDRLIGFARTELQHIGDADLNNHTVYLSTHVRLTGNDSTMVAVVVVERTR